jgi:hypothetical protein
VGVYYYCENIHGEFSSGSIFDIKSLSLLRMSVGQLELVLWVAIAVVHKAKIHDKIDALKLLKIELT